MSVDLGTAPAAAGRSAASSAAPVRLSIVMEWANTKLHGESRAAVLLDRLARQWSEVAARSLPSTLAPEEVAFLGRLDARAELVIVTGEALGPDLDPALRERVADVLDLSVVVAPGLEYYPLKNRGARDIRGDLLLFVDSDVLPEQGWLAHLVSTFARRDVDVVAGQTYVAPTDPFARAFALGWTYELRDDSGRLMKPRKFYANNMMFRTEVFRRCGFRDLGRRSRGACSLLREDLEREGIPIWENRRARVDHPPPMGLRHMIVRALAHGRDHYMKRSEGRSVRGLLRSTGIAGWRLGRGAVRTLRHGRDIGVGPLEMPYTIAVIAGYYAIFAAGGVLTHIHPGAMAARFRV